MGANILLEPAQLEALGGDESASVKAGVRWRRLAGREEGVGGRSGLGGRETLLSPVGCACTFSIAAGRVVDWCNADSAAQGPSEGPHQHSQQRAMNQTCTATASMCPGLTTVACLVLSCYANRYRHSVTEVNDFLRVLPNLLRLLYKLQSAC